MLYAYGHYRIDADQPDPSMHKLADYAGEVAYAASIADVLPALEDALQQYMAALDTADERYTAWAQSTAQTLRANADLPHIQHPGPDGTVYWWTKLV